jgi:hypothetical protein
MRNTPLWQRILYFIAALIGWFFIAYHINTSYSDPLVKAENLKGLWIVSTFVIAILWSFFFKKRKPEVGAK